MDVVEFVSKRLNRLLWLAVAIIGLHMVFAGNAVERPTRASVIIEPIAAVDAAPQRHSID
ncbi:hypothetical protein [Maricaulis sp.]|uniref:hypothetical protein n=1 Tax=Maricaulis sp. TaxID=1486257 RepID=UPI00260838B8|nr:hypothetical protein [Maricaulis sp.]